LKSVVQCNLSGHNVHTRALRPIQSTLITEVSFPDVQLSVSDIHSSPPPNTGIQNAWRYTSTPAHAFVKRRLMQHKDDTA